jgi:hypothetical protein
MSNDLIVPGKQPTLLEIRMDSKKYPRLCRYTKEEADLAMVKIVSQAILYRGQNMEASTISFTASSLVDELMREDKYGAKYLSIEEIAIIVKKAVLETDIYVSVSTLYRAILDFCKGEGSRINQEAATLKRKQDEESLRNSVVAPMLQAYTGAFIKEHKVK